MKNFDQDGDMVDPMKIFLSSTLIPVQNWVAVAACAYVVNPQKIWGKLDPALLEWKA